jgi:hypothetical protein
MELPVLCRVTVMSLKSRVPCSPCSMVTMMAHDKSQAAVLANLRFVGDRVELDIFNGVT